MIDYPRLTRLLGGAELAWLVQRVRRRMARGEPLDGAVTLSGASAEQRAAVHRLLGRRPRAGDALTVSLPAVDDVLRRSGACPGGLAEAVVALEGEVTDHAKEAAALAEAWDEAFAPVAVVVQRRPELTDWFERLSDGGVVRRLARTPQAAGPLLADLASVIAELPAADEPLGHFAARVAGGAHALDDDRPLGTLAFGAARALARLPDGQGAEWRRAVWAGVGLLRDDLSSTVLTLGLAGDARTPTGRALAALREDGQPAVLTLRQLVHDDPEIRVRDVFVCEGPVVVAAAADRLERWPAMVCTSGQPSAAALHLLRRLAASGAVLRYHGDFDWGGIRIANVVFDRVPAQPWRFGAGDYVANVREGGQALRGRPATPRWDDRLGSMMREAGVAVEEEQVLADLLADLDS